MIRCCWGRSLSSTADKLKLRTAFPSFDLALQANCGPQDLIEVVVQGLGGLPRIKVEGATFSHTISEA